MSVLDASAVLALLQREPGAEAILLSGAVLCTVNLAEVATVLTRDGKPVGTLPEELQFLGIELRPFSAREARLAGELYERTHPYGLSVGDRACLAVAKLLDTVAVTADRAWLDVPHGVQVRAIR